MPGQAPAFQIRVLADQNLYRCQDAPGNEVLTMLSERWAAPHLGSLPR